MGTQKQQEDDAVLVMASKLHGMGLQLADANNRWRELRDWIAENKTEFEVQDGRCYPVVNSEDLQKKIDEMDQP